MPTDVIKIDVDFFSRYNLAKRVYKTKTFVMFMAESTRNIF